MFSIQSSLSLCVCAEGKVVKADMGEVSQQHSSSKKERDREEQELNDSDEEGDLLEEDEEEVRILSVHLKHTLWFVTTEGLALTP